MAAPAPAVTGVALKFGFVHFGRFAQQYRRSLGVRSSDTPGYDVIREPE